MRGLIDGLETPHPIGLMLPALFQEDGFAQRLTQAFDDELAPILSTLDNVDAYFDPWLTPVDFLDWLAGWVGVALDETWPVERRRVAVARAVELYRLRGMAAGLAEQVALMTGAQPEIDESGGVSWSTTSGSPVPGSADPHLKVTVRVADPGTPEARRLAAAVDAVVADAKPAHVPHEVEAVQG